MDATRVTRSPLIGHQAAVTTEDRWLTVVDGETSTINLSTKDVVNHTFDGSEGLASTFPDLVCDNLPVSISYLHDMKAPPKSM